MNYTKHSDQRDDGGFDHYVVFGDVAPWDAPDEVCVKLATEQDADKLMSLLMSALTEQMPDECEELLLIAHMDGYYKGKQDGQKVPEGMQLVPLIPVDISVLVDAFLSWRLPDDFSPDSGISFVEPKDLYAGIENANELYWPTGTNLINADQVKLMIDHISKYALKAARGES